MNKYKKILTSSLMVLGTCLSLVGCDMGGNDNPSGGGSIQPPVETFENAVINQKNVIISDIVSKVTNQKNRFITNPGTADHWIPKGDIDPDVNNYNLIGATYKGEKDNLIYGNAFIYLGKIQNGSRWEGGDGNLDFEMPVFIAFDKSNNMLYSSQNSGFNSGLAQDMYGAAYDYDFALNGLFMPTLKSGSLSKVFFNHDYVNYCNTYGSIDMFGFGYNNIISILPNDGKLQVGLYQNNLSFLNAKIKFLAYRYGYKQIDYDPGYRHFWVFDITVSLDEMTNKLNVSVN